MNKTYHGSCHCGAVRFECDIDLADGTSKCNCSICRKARFWKAFVNAARFRLVQGADALSDYTFSDGSKNPSGQPIHHFFCRTCGVKTFGQSNLEALGGDFYAINVACLDDVSDEELAAAPVEYQDGRADHWERPPAVTAYL
jgi:hypothetical protein